MSADPLDRGVDHRKLIDAQIADLLEAVIHHRLGFGLLFEPEVADQLSAALDRAVGGLEVGGVIPGGIEQLRQTHQRLLSNAAIDVHVEVRVHAAEQRHQRLGGVIDPDRSVRHIQPLGGEAREEGHRRRFAVRHGPDDVGAGRLRG